MPRQSRLFVSDMLAAARRIVEAAGNLSTEELQVDESRQESILWNLHVLGEAAKHVPEEVRVLNSEIDWRRASAMRNRIIHEYFGIDWGIVRHTIDNHMQSLIAGLESLLKQLDADQD